MFKRHNRTVVRKNIRLRFCRYFYRKKELGQNFIEAKAGEVAQNGWDLKRLSIVLNEILSTKQGEWQAECIEAKLIDYATGVAPKVEPAQFRASAFETGKTKDTNFGSCLLFLAPNAGEWDLKRLSIVLNEILSIKQGVLRAIYNCEAKRLCVWSGTEGGTSGRWRDAQLLWHRARTP